MYSFLMEYIYFTAKKRVLKLQRTAQITGNNTTSRKRIFIVGGFELPFLSTLNAFQPMEKSYAVTFFEQKPIYNTQQQACSGTGIVDDNFTIDEEEKTNLKTSVIMIEKRIKRLWVRINKAKDYTNWDNWWKDFKWCDRNLNYKLKALGSINIQSFFHPSHPDKTTEEMINEIMNSANIVLNKTVHDPVKILHTIYMLMNETFLENLRNSEIEKLQDIIVSIPNSWWVYAMRRFLFTWSEYYKIANSREWKPTKTRNMTYELIRNRWESPVFHWLAKQVILELKVRKNEFKKNYIECI